MLKRTRLQLPVLPRQTHHFHISAELGYISGDIHRTDILDGFAKGKGISPASNDEVARICEKFIKTK